MFRVPGAQATERCPHGDDRHEKTPPRSEATEGPKKDAGRPYDDAGVSSEDGDGVALRIEVAAEELEEEGEEVPEGVVVLVEHFPLVRATPEERVAASYSRRERRPTASAFSRAVVLEGA